MQTHIRQVFGTTQQPLTGVDNGQHCSYHAYKDNLAKNQREGVNLFCCGCNELWDCRRLYAPNKTSSICNCTVMIIK